LPRRKPALSLDEWVEHRSDVILGGPRLQKVR
jgi:hypothetical protein